MGHWDDEKEMSEHSLSQSRPWKAWSIAAAVILVVFFVGPMWHNPSRCTTANCSLSSENYVIHIASTKVSSSGVFNGKAHSKFSPTIAEDEADTAADTGESVEDTEDDDLENAPGEDGAESAVPAQDGDLVVGHEEGGNVQPTLFDKARVILVTGLRSSGQAKFREVFATHCGKTVHCKALCLTTSSKYIFEHNVASFNRARRLVVEEFKQVAGDRSTLYIASLHGEPCRNNADSMAFPPAELPFHSRDHPDLLDLERIAAEANVDLRILVPMYRTTESLAQAWLERPPPGKWTELRLLQVLEVQLHQLFAHLLMMEPARFRLFDITNGEVAGDAQLDEWMGVPGAAAFLATKRSEMQPKPFEVSAGSRMFLEDVDPVLKMIWGLSAFAESGLHKGETPGKMQPLVRKTVLSTAENPRPKLVFFVGLEGTGHHLWRSVLTPMLKEKQVLPACLVQQLLYENSYRNSLWHSSEAPEYAKAKLKLAKHLSKLGLDEASKNSTFLANLLDPKKKVCTGWAGMMSYPNFSGSNKNQQRPNMLALAKLAEAAGVDLRIVVMFREVEAVIASTVDHRHFAGEGNEIRILQSNAMGILATFATIDRSFISNCVEFEDTAHTFLPAMEETLGSDKVSENFRRIAKVNSTFSGRSSKAANRATVLTTLRETNDLIKGYCPGRSP